MPNSFKSIRPWEGTKDRAFEEICYQLLRDPEDLPPNMRGLPIRTGNPDGGLEWYARTSDGGEWGWQAKYIEDIDSLLKGMTKTVERVTKKRPQLTRLTFCIPMNLSAGTAGGRQTPGYTRYTATRRHGYLFPLVRGHRMRNGADKPELGLRHCFPSTSWCPRRWQPSYSHCAPL